MRLLIHFLSMCLLLFLIFTPVYSATIHVDVDAAGNNDGSDWANAFTNLQTALDDARNNTDATDEIWVADGTYYPGTARTDFFEMINGVGIYGGFSGVELSLVERDVEGHVTILSGDIGTPNDDTDNSYHVFYHGAFIIDATAILDGFTVTGGNANGSLLHNDGGGMYNVNASPMITNCTFKGNQAADYGGGIHANSSSTVFRNCSFTENKSVERGGGMHIKNSDMTFLDCTFSDNLSIDDHGGGIYIDRSFPTFTNCIFSQNQAVMAGAISTFNAAPTLIDCTFTENKAVNVGGVWNNGNSDYEGPLTTFTNCSFNKNQADELSGGIANSIDSVLIMNCSFTENQAQDAGGIYNNGASSTIISCTFTGNLATNNGSGIYNFGNSKIVSSLFIENIAGGDGGGIYTYHSNPETNNETPSITNCTFSLNQAGGYGGGICSASEVLPSNYPSDFPIPSPTIMNCILWGNTAATAGSEIYADISTPMLSNNLIEGSGGSGAGWPLGLGVDGGSNIDTDPMFADNVSFRLMPESPCIDSGNMLTFTAGVDIDLEPRFYDGKGDGKVIADIGADEYVNNEGTDPSNVSAGSSDSSNDDSDDSGCFISTLKY